MFLGWFDDTPKKSVAEKIREAVERYKVKFGEAPNVCLVNTGDVIASGPVPGAAASYPGSAAVSSTSVGRLDSSSSSSSSICGSRLIFRVPGIPQS